MPNHETILRKVDGLTYRQLDHWTRAGYLRLTSEARGSGHSRDWPSREIPVIETMFRLTKAGCGPALAERIARAEGGRLDLDGLTLHIELSDCEEVAA